MGRSRAATIESSQTSDLSKIHKYILDQYGITDTSNLVVRPTTYRTEPDPETGASEDVKGFELVDSKTGKFIPSYMGGQVNNVWQSISLDSKGKPVLTQSKIEKHPGDFFSGLGEGVTELAKSAPGQLLLMAATAGAGGAAGLGNSLFGLSGTAGTVAGGAALGAGKAALTGGDILRGALTGGLGGAGGVDIGDTSFSVGDAMTAAKMAQAAQKGDFMGALAGAASLTGGSDFKIGDFTVGELLKDAKLAQSMFGGKQGPGAIRALTNFANTKQNDVVNTLKDAGLTQADASPITPAAKTAAPTTPMPAAQPTGIDPVALLQAQMSGDNGGAQIKSDYSLFGKELFGPDKASASSTQARNAPQSDALMAALGNGGYDEQEFSGGGDVHALLQLLRS